MKKLLLSLLFISVSLFAQTKKIDPAQLKPFIPKDYTNMERAKGDFNEDGYADVILKQ